MHPLLQDGCNPHPDAPLPPPPPRCSMDRRPPQCSMETVNRRSVRILLESILVLWFRQTFRYQINAGADANHEYFKSYVKKLYKSLQFKIVLKIDQ